MSDKHPPPWRWVRPGYPPDDDADMPNEDALSLRDAKDMEIVGADGDGQSWVIVPSPLVREQLRLAAEMEARLRYLEARGSGSKCADCLALPHAAGCKLAAILDALDAARKEEG